MSRFAKFMVTLVGIILVLLAVFELGQLYPIPWLTEWLAEMTVSYPMVWSSLLIVFAAVAGIVGILMIIVGLFRPVKVNTLTYEGDHGQLTIPQRALERDLQYRLVSQLNLIDPDVQIKLRNRHRVRVKIDSMVSGKAKLESVAKQAAVIAQDYLSQQLGLKVEQPVVQVRPADHERKLTVV
ncbi:alkaline shock response membrane anchor protein AmaP [Lactiplantibacillus pentosus]|uniref:alkaline shock response membrane anchor protein AmaP n=1 Tax=Lactiplantibacillus pentosus TaxID=1589 RepID=UPI001932148C|nr:alkaline shock response membrane anchor protein AmaP [Lactiplantibacillus pentosus]